LVRDEELKRLIKYSEALGAKVVFRQKREEDPAACIEFDKLIITVYRMNKQSKLSIILCIVHELGHLLEHIHNMDRNKNHPLYTVLVEEQSHSLEKPDRAIILEIEEAGAQWWDQVYKECNLQFPIEKLQLERDFDLWVVSQYHENGQYPTTKVNRAKRKELRKKYRYKGYRC
jgi:hypothetical protein